MTSPPIRDRPRDTLTSLLRRRIWLAIDLAFYFERFRSRTIFFSAGIARPFKQHPQRQLSAVVCCLSAAQRRSPFVYARSKLRDSKLRRTVNVARSLARVNEPNVTLPTVESAGARANIDPMPADASAPATSPSARPKECGPRGLARTVNASRRSTINQRATGNGQRATASAPGNDFRFLPFADVVIAMLSLPLSISISVSVSASGAIRRLDTEKNGCVRACLNAGKRRYGRCVRVGNPHEDSPRRAALLRFARPCAPAARSAQQSHGPNSARSLVRSIQLHSTVAIDRSHSGTRTTNSSLALALAAAVAVAIVATHRAPFSHRRSSASTSTSSTSSTAWLCASTTRRERCHNGTASRPDRCTNTTDRPATPLPPVPRAARARQPPPPPAPSIHQHCRGSIHIHTRTQTQIHRAAQPPALLPPTTPYDNDPIRRRYLTLRFALPYKPRHLRTQRQAAATLAPPTSRLPHAIILTRHLQSFATYRLSRQLIQRPNVHFLRSKRPTIDQD